MDSATGSFQDEEVVLFPLRSQDPDVKVLRVARVPSGQLDSDTVQHFAGGPYKGIIVSKASQALPSRERPECVREFLAHVQNVTANDTDNVPTTREKRQIFTWFVPGIDNKEAIADRFFKEVIDPENFPKDYISFVKKVVVLARSYPQIRVLELELCPVPEEYASPPTSPGVYPNRNSIIRETSVTMDTEKLTSHEQRSPDTDVTNENHLINNNVSKDEDISRRAQEDMRNIEESRLSTGEELQDYNSDLANVKAGSLLRKKEVDHHIANGTALDNGQSTDDDVQGAPPTEEELVEIREHILLIMEDAFPMALKADHIAEDARISPSVTRQLLEEFQARGLAQELGDGRWIRVSTIKRKAKKAKAARTAGSYTSRASSIASVRESGANHEFQVVNQMPILPDHEQPTIAVITLLFCEKQAVDAMMEDKITYVKYKKEGAGENQVYTIGVIGVHKVVSTKLTRIGTGQGATVSAGNSITRLLGTFGKVEHVFLVGVGGSIPNYDDDSRHIRCGDVVISKPKSSGQASYVYVKEVVKESSKIRFATQYWTPKDLKVLEIISNLSERYGPQSMVNTDLAQNIQSGLVELGGQELSFTRPTADADHLHKMDSDGAWDDATHPEPASDSIRATFPDRPVVFFGAVGSGFDQLVQGTQDYRQDLATFNDIRVLDSGYQAVMESIDGNRKDSFWTIRGVADYMDGMSGTVWQPYASLVAAAALKLILMRISK